MSDDRHGVLTDVLWTEKYRPDDLGDLALSDEIRKVLQSYLDAGEIPHLLLCGPPGTGKTTVARIIYRSLDCRVLALNASDERGIDVVREKIATFVTAMTEARWQIVFLDEADYMTTEAQTALRNLIEKYADRARFILTANYLHKVIGAIQSRCLLVELQRPPIKERVRILAKVLKAEGIAIPDPGVLFTYVERYPDLRKMLMSAQRAYLSHGELPPAKGDGPMPADDMFAMLKQKNYPGFRDLTKDGAFDPYQGLTTLFWAIPDEDPAAGMLRHVLGKAVHESSYTPDPIIHFLGTVAEAMESL